MEKLFNRTKTGQSPLVGGLYFPQARQAACWQISDTTWEVELEQCDGTKRTASIILRMVPLVRMWRIPLNSATATHALLSSPQLRAILRESHWHNSWVCIMQIRGTEIEMNASFVWVISVDVKARLSLQATQLMLLVFAPDCLPFEFT